MTEAKELKKLAPHAHAPPAVEVEKAGHAAQVVFAVPPPMKGWYVFAGQFVQVEVVVVALDEYVFAAQGVQMGALVTLQVAPAAAM